MFYFGSVSVRFLKKNSDSVRNEFGSVRFEKMQFVSNMIVIYYLCNRRILQQILQCYCLGD